MLWSGELEALMGGWIQAPVIYLELVFYLMGVVLLVLGSIFGWTLM